MGLRGTVATMAEAPLRPLRRLDPDRLGDHLDRLYRAAWGLCGAREEAEDLVQDTYTRVLARPRWLRDEDDLGYLLRALRNTHANRLRTRSRRPRTSPLDEEAVSGAHAAAAPADTSLELAGLFAAIAALPEAQREAVAAVDLAGLSYREAARALRVRETTLTNRLHRARMRLGEVLGSEGAA